MPLRNTLVRLALSLAALILCPQPADAQQPPPSAWSIGGTVGFGYAGGEGASVMRLPWVLACRSSDGSVTGRGGSASKNPPARASDVGWDGHP